MKGDGSDGNGQGYSGIFHGIDGIALNGESTLNPTNGSCISNFHKFGYMRHVNRRSIENVELIF